MEGPAIAAIAEGALTIIAQLINEEPALAADFQAIFSGNQLTPANIQALITNLQAETYGQFVPTSALPPSETNT